MDTSQVVLLVAAAFLIGAGLTVFALLPRTSRPFAATTFMLALSALLMALPVPPALRTIAILTLAIASVVVTVRAWRSQHTLD